MKLNKDIDPIDFFKVVQTCPGDVLFCTDEGDRLDLKSKLSQYLFIACSMDQGPLEAGYIVCENPEDAQTLSEFIVE